MRSFPNYIALLILSLIFNVTFKAYGYEVYGTISNYDSLWSSKIYLAIVEPDKPYWSISADQIINEAEIDEDGNFQLKGINLTDDRVIARLYVSKPNIRVSFQSSPRNYLVFTLDNNSVIQINSNTSFEPEKYDISGSYLIENNAIKAFHELCYQSYNKYEDDPNLYLIIEKREFKTEARNFIEKNPLPLVSLIVTHDISEFEDDYLQNRSFYDQMNRQLLSADNQSAYAQAFNERLSIIKFKNGLIKEEVDKLGNEKERGVYMLIAGGGVLIVVFVFFYFRRKSKPSNKVDPNIDLVNSLTRREKEILILLIEGRQNKEIAEELHLSVSTIKTHVSSLFKKLNIENRNEAIIYKAYV